VAEAVGAEEEAPALEDAALEDAAGPLVDGSDSTGVDVGAVGLSV
jgi:hypothetical protein